MEIYFFKCLIFFHEYKCNFIEYKNTFLLQISNHINLTKQIFNLQNLSI